MADGVKEQSFDLGECYTMCWVVDNKIRLAPVAYKVTALANDHVKTDGGEDVERSAFVRKVYKEWGIPYGPDHEEEHTLTHIYHEGKSLREKYGYDAPGMPHKIFERIGIYEGDELIVAPVIKEQEVPGRIEIKAPENWPDGALR